MSRASGIRRDARGTAVIETALVLPVALLLLIAVFEFTYEQYVQAVLDGVVKEAGRSSALQNADFAAIDTKARNAVMNVAPDAVVAFTRRTYATFANIGPERFADLNANGKIDKGECFEDVNGNGVWDSDPGTDGQGGADDVTVLTGKATYPQLFPLSELLGRSPDVEQTAVTALRNQPYAKQTVTAVKTVCKT